jgi:hypothetical protein
MDSELKLAASAAVLGELDAGSELAEKSDSEVQTMYERFHCNLKMDHGIFFMSDNQIKLTISKFRKTKFKEYQFSFRAGIPAISRLR